LTVHILMRSGGREGRGGEKRDPLILLPWSGGLFGRGGGGIPEKTPLMCWPQPRRRGGKEGRDGERITVVEWHFSGECYPRRRQKAWLSLTPDPKKGKKEEGGGGKC